MTEFTGERVIPGEVNDDLWAEHIARYAFAAHYSAGRATLDIGCGAGYGAAELAPHARLVVGTDISADAVAFARAHYPLANVHFLQASANALPFGHRSFDVVTAFEVIEHLEDWRALLSEARRVLNRAGVFLVSTPNKLYYAETRVQDGPNPFHTHEFEFGEFREALAEFFPRVTILLQNRLESFAFCPEHAAFPPLDARIDGTRGSAAQAHFFIAVCSVERAPEPRSFLYVPRAANLLREREHHIEVLKNELDSVIADRQKLIEAHEALTAHLEEHNRWALQLEKDWREGLDRIAELQDENIRKTEWAIETEKRLTGELTERGEELAHAVRLLNAAEATVIERTHWAQELDARLQRLEAQFEMLRQSRWLKLGRVFGLGPRVDGGA